MRLGSQTVEGDIHLELLSQDLKDGLKNGQPLVAQEGRQRVLGRQLEDLIQVILILFLLVHRGHLAMVSGEDGVAPDLLTAPIAGASILVIRVVVGRPRVVLTVV
jgi:hypothetical protein